MTGKSKNVERYFLNKKAQDRALDIDINWEEEIKYDPRIQKQIDAYHPNHREREEGNTWKPAPNMQFSSYNYWRQVKKV
jgi:hypothetical protein